MRYICNKALDAVVLDGRDMKPVPCGECQEVIAETVAAFNDDGHNYIDEEFDISSEIDLGDSEW